MTTQELPTIVLGGGIAGLAVAWELVKRGSKVTLIEKAKVVGGLARTLEFDGFKFDIGGHRFHSNNPAVVNWAQELLTTDLLDVPRQSHIRLGDKFIDYPIRFPGALTIFSPLMAARVLGSYALAQLFPSKKPELSFEDWVVHRYGRELYNVYFKPYTEKVWGISCTDLSKQWAAQRISLPSLGATVRQALFPSRVPPKTIINHFYYPKNGFGMIVERLKTLIEANGGEVICGASVQGVDPDSGTVTYQSDDDKTPHQVVGSQIISTIPVSLLLRAFPADSGAKQVDEAYQLTYRDLIIVDLAIKRQQVSSDSWTYFPMPDLIFGRTHEPKNWSPAMVPSPDVTSLAVEIFSTRGETVWQMTDDDIVNKVVAQMDEIGWIKKSELIKGWVVRVPFAYPVYYVGYETKLQEVLAFFARWPKLHLVGRTGAFKYMNSDGVIEDVFGLVQQLFPDDAMPVSALTKEVERWA